MYYHNDQHQDYVNFSANTDFPYYVLDVMGHGGYPNEGHILHRYPYVQFIYVLQGTICVQTREEEKHINTGEGVFINKNVLHMIKQLSPCHYFCFAFAEGSFLKAYNVAKDNKKNRTSLTRLNLSLCYLNMHKKWSMQALKILQELVSLESKKDECYTYKVMTSLSQLVCIFKNNVISSVRKNAKLSTTQFQKLLRYIEAHYMEDISLDTLAKSANITKAQCLQCFKLNLNTTPHCYLNEYRLLKSEQLLRDTSLSVNEIALQVGFCQAGYFGKLFREKKGCSPKKYRRSLFASYAKLLLHKKNTGKMVPPWLINTIDA
jgi:AraC-like DNA-binding protein